MSLFPAYSSTSSTSTTDNDNKPIKSETDPKNQTFDWLSFNSFNDKTVIELNNELIDPKSDTNKDNRSDRKTDKSRKSDKNSVSTKSHSKKSDLSRKQTTNESKNLSQFLSSKTFIEETGLSSQNAYRFDTKSDKNNLSFNSLYFKNVSNYEKNKTINISKRKSSKTDDSKPNKKFKKMRYFSTENRLMLSKSSEGLIDLSKPEMRPMKESLNFIPINSEQAFNRLSFQANTNQSNPLGVYDLKTALWSEGKGSLDEIPIPESRIQFESMKDKNEKKEPIGPKRAPTREQEIYTKTQEFNTYLRDNELDIEKWIKFIDFQNKINESIDSGMEKIDGKSAEIVISEKQLLICEKALNFNPKSIQLLLKRLEIVSNIWEFNRLEKEWKRLTFLYPNSLDLWRKYILFSKQNITHFKSTKTVKIYEKCVSILSQMLEKTFKSHSPPENLEQELVFILSSYCRFLQTIGQTERAVSTYQALIEFNLFTPNLLTYEMSIQDWTTFFEPFWDSRCARFGEDGAIGWSEVMVKKNIEKNDDKTCQHIQRFIDEEENKIISESKSEKNVVWLKFELMRQRFHWLSVRGVAEEDQEVDDPERIVSSDDITEMLVRFREPDSKCLLIEQFLEFLNVCHKSDDKISRRSDDCLETFTEIIPDFRLELPLLPQFFGQQNVIKNIFKSSLKLFSGENKSKLVLIWIKYEKNKISDKMSAKEMRKFLKDFLRDDSFRNDLNVWSEFVSFEYSLNENRIDGRKVFRTAIELMIKTSENRENLFRFVRNYIELELDLRSLAQMSEKLAKHSNPDSITDELCLNSLLSLSCGQMVSNSTPTLVLKSINNLKQLFEPTIDQLFCLVLIQYLTKGISTAIQTIEELLSTKQTFINEKQLFSLYLQILLLNICRNCGQSSIKPLRSVLNRALNSYPSEPQFLSLFINIESKSNIFSRMRRFFAKTYQSVVNEKSSSDNLTLILFAIQSELRRLDTNNETFTAYDTNSGIVNRVRVLFERWLTTSTQLSNCVTLWRLYCKFELNCNNKTKAKSVFYRALQVGPYSKILYLDGIQYFSTQIQELIDIMTEKELRIRTPLEEIDLLVNNFG